MSAQKPQIIGIHLDLKYTMPKKSYLLQWLKRLPRLGINTLLLEYEDKFPFAKYPFLCAEEAFTEKELLKFLATARGAGLRVIPLVQTLSHLEFALVHDELAHLREAPDVPTQICPSNPQAVSFVRELLAEVLHYHDEDEFFHVGADEAWHLGNCPKCAQRVEGGDKFPLWAEHVNEICRFISEKGKRPIVWDDALRNTPEKVTNLRKDIILHNWNYGTTDLVDGKAPFHQVEVYKAAGRDVVGGPCLNQGVIVPAKNHCLKNTAIWCKKVKATGILGLINTAWASFHVPLPLTWLEIAATGAMFNDDTEIDAAWEEAFWREEFCFVAGGERKERSSSAIRADAAGVPDAMEKLGKSWSLRVEGLGRPIAAGLYAYTDMVVWFKGGQTERRKRGAYPLDWNDIDFPGIYSKKLHLFKTSPDIQTVYAKLDELAKTYDEARATLRELAKKAGAHQSEARLFAAFADIKLLNVRVLSHLLRGDPPAGGRETLRRELMAQKGCLIEALSPFLEPFSVARMLTIWWDPLLVALSGGREADVALRKEQPAPSDEPEY